VDVGYGDAVTPEPELVLFPVILEGHPSPQLLAYPKETVIAEKLEALVALGIANSRMKDYLDLYVLFGEQAVAQEKIASAIRRTFERRRTPLPQSLPGLSGEFSGSPAKVELWKAFLSRNALEAVPLDVVVASLRKLIEPIIVEILKASS
jgi:hypothetical protein